jgi:diguanylate cyclase
MRGAILTMTIWSRPTFGLPTCIDEPTNMELLVHIAPWVLASVAIGIVAGYFIARSRTQDIIRNDLSPENQAVLKMLAELLSVAEHIATNVNSHNTEIEANVQQVDHLNVTGEMAVIKQSLMQHMASLLTSNRHLQEDLICTRYRLEEQAQEIDHVRREARSDALTEVPNRRAFDEKLHLLMNDWRQENKPFAIILADLDQFKRVNDAHGHQAGDRVLKAAGSGLKQLAREGDFVSRYGGDEFAILMPNIACDAASKLADAIRIGIGEHSFCVAVRNGEVSISFSMGVAAPRDGDTDESVLQRADQALYRAKHTGRNHVECETPKEEPVPA